ncbi:hypothetical protein [Rummeliibacillus pycnus]|uniref:hypothetical protein n=1 Tax=Rummeliibacillus pycnus TaxID=101070 RepID=UPI0037C86444
MPEVAYALNYYTFEGVANGRAIISNYTLDYDTSVITVTKDTVDNRLVVTPV